MAKIRILRGTNEALAKTENLLEAGQLFYNIDRNTLCVGADGSELLKNKKPICCEEVIGDNVLINGLLSVDVMSRRILFTVGSTDGDHIALGMKKSNRSTSATEVELFTQHGLILSQKDSEGATLSQLLMQKGGNVTLQSATGALSLIGSKFSGNPSASACRIDLCDGYITLDGDYVRFHQQGNEITLPNYSCELGSKVQVINLVIYGYNSSGERQRFGEMCFLYQGNPNSLDAPKLHSYFESHGCIGSIMSGVIYSIGVDMLYPVSGFYHDDNSGLNIITGIAACTHFSGSTGTETSSSFIIQGVSTSTTYVQNFSIPAENIQIVK